MTRTAIVALSVAVGGALLLFVTLGRPWPAPAQQPAAQTPLPAGYVGAETCKGCHEEAFKKFETTRMGRLFLKQPRNTTESLGCESCHGPGQKHVEAGGGKGVGGMITFAKNDKTPVETRNAMCTTCHTKRPRHLRQPGGVLVEQRLAHVPEIWVARRRQPLHQGQRAVAGGQPVVLEQRRPQLLPHAVARREDDVHVVPQPSRDGHTVAPEGSLAQQHLLHVPCREARTVSLGAPAGQRELRQLSRSARLQPREHAAGREAATLSAVPHREPASHESLRS